MRETYAKRRAERLKQVEKDFGETLNNGISRLYWTENLTQEKIAKKLGLPRVLIIKLMKEYHLKKRPNFEHISHLRGKDHSMYGKKWEEVYGVERARRFRQERSLSSRVRIIKRLENREMPFRDTKIEKMISNEMKKRGIVFIPQYAIDGKFVCDFFIPKYNLVIECDGDYWHANPLIYNSNKLDTRQINKVRRDKWKDKYLREKGFIIMRFFETDINKSVSDCIDKVVERIKKVENPFDTIEFR